MEFSNDLQLALYKSYGLLRQLIQKFQCVYWTGFVIRITNCNLTRLQWGIYLFTIDQLTCPYTCIQLLSVPGSRRIGTGWLTLNTNLIQSLIIQFNLLLVLSRWSKRYKSIQQHLIYQSLFIHHQQNVFLIHRIRHLTSIQYCSRSHNKLDIHVILMRYRYLTHKSVMDSSQAVYCRTSGFSSYITS